MEGAAHPVGLGIARLGEMTVTGLTAEQLGLVPCQALMLGLHEVVRGPLAAPDTACQPPNQLTQH
jgi:hypothetical protein